MDVVQLKRFALFEGVEDAKLAKIAPFTQLVEFSEGKVIMQEGAYSNDFFAIEEGEVSVTKDGTEVAKLGPGDVFGEQGLLEHEQRSATITALNTVRALKIETWELMRMRKAMPEVVEQLKATVAARSGNE